MAQITAIGQSAVAQPAMANKRIKYLIGSVAVFVAIAFLIVNALASTGQYYLTVSELLEKGDAIVGRPARVSGFVVAESVDWNAPELVLKFNISEAGVQLPIIFHGPMPDNLTRPEAEAIVEGKLLEDGTFQARTLLVKCPSRYEEQEIIEVKAID